MNLKERARIIERIIHADTSIWGAEVCQACGEVGTYSGWAGAMASHWTDGNDFVCLHHHHADQDGRRALLRATSRRWCEVCQKPLDRERAHRLSHYYLCDECAADPPSNRNERWSPLHDLSKQRHLEMQSDEVLRGWA